MNERRATLLTTQYVQLATCTLVILFGLCVASIASAATYTFSPASASHEVGDTFSVRIVIDPQGSPVNSGEATINFDSDTLSVSGISTNGSPFSIWTPPTPDGPTYSNTTGTITFSGGGLSTISTARAVATVNFRAKAEGTGTVSVESGKLLAADGRGTDVYEDGAGATYTISPATTPEPTPTPTPQPDRTLNIPVPDAPSIDSPTHPEDVVWSNVTDVEFEWDIPYGVIKTKHIWGVSATATPQTEHEPPITSYTVEDVEDGTWYFGLAYANRGGYGSTTYYRIMIDTVPPEPFEVEGVGGDLTAQFRFEAADELSGVARYEIELNNGRVREVAPDELSGDGYTVQNIDPGEHVVLVTAYDQAGNTREATATVVVTGELPIETSDVEEVSVFGAVYWLSILFVIVLTVLVYMLIHERRRAREEKDHVKREAMEAGEKLINIFGVLREEIEEKVLELSHKPNMTDNERAILEGLKDALDISEELIDKEIEDVRKLLK